MSLSSRIHDLKTATGGVRPMARKLRRAVRTARTMLDREERTHIAKACFEFLPTRARLDLAGWPETDIFAHS